MHGQQNVNLSCGFKPSALWCHTFWETITNIYEELAASVSLLPSPRRTGAVCKAAVITLLVSPSPHFECLYLDSHQNPRL